ncbi:hypothetical protein HanHA300_Chr04g0115381 [Helianthus annuus]|nr:hypothetical protein HanHA300_Chr04g0115381 [Helianthus annuus]KAJ0755785.1 hypothetical protein HanLR1_Chr04g0119751 [Helianthus annuus]
MIWIRVSYRENVMEHDRSLRGLITMRCEYEITDLVNGTTLKIFPMIRSEGATIYGFRLKVCLLLLSMLM